MGIDAAAFRSSERKRLLVARQSCDAAMLALWSDALTDLLAAHMAREMPRILGFYWPHRDEYDPMRVVEQVIAHGRQVALPVVVGRGEPLEYRRWHPGIAMTVSRRSFDIPHPAEGPSVMPDMLLVPLLGFDGQGYRLGYGGGYFDRTLAAWAARPKTIGVGFELGRLTSIHPEPHDIPMDLIVTECGVFPRV
jgi:5-formyltetrahydrofolate cyclo-ligase